MKYYKDYLEHFNPNHDALGRFAKAVAGAASKGAKTANDIERQKRIARDVAIGAAVVGGVIATGATISYLRQKNYESSKAKISKEFKRRMMMDIPATDLPAGSILSRISTVVENGFGDNDYTYATYTEADKHRYAYAMGRERGTSSLFEMALEATAPIKAPSSKKQFGMFNELMKSKNPGFRQAIFDSYGEGWDADRPPNSKTFPDLYDHFIDHLYHYKKSSGIRPEEQIFREYAMRQGFNALIDTTDAGIIGDRPLYVIDPQDTLTVRKVRKMNRGRRVINGLFLEGMGDMRTFDYT